MIKMRNESLKKSTCCKTCVYSRPDWDFLTCYLVPDNIHIENNALKTVHLEDVCILWKGRDNDK